MKKIIIDTNFLVSMVRFKVDLFSELQRICDFKYMVCIVKGIINELEKLAETGKPKDKIAAMISLELIKKKKIKIIKTPPKNKRVKNVDLLILNLIKKGNFIVATQDKELKREIRKKGVPIIALRQKKYLKLII
ncbi:MAG: hypothetical protein KKA61_04270 [Nanoarchaeota archaeon]|nr:hypothetical protein [Nanoarchaeota archaeon]MBU4284199.1 hypothetical protein [Nanoarchaeota archaeon]MBU4493561.1 hypothetical protein [Nanoarchaeota archaeon]